MVLVAENFPFALPSVVHRQNPAEACSQAHHTQLAMVAVSQEGLKAEAEVVSGLKVGAVAVERAHFGNSCLTCNLLAYLVVQFHRSSWKKDHLVSAAKRVAVVVAVW